MSACGRYINSAKAIGRNSRPLPQAHLRWRLIYLRCPMSAIEVLKFGSSVLRTPDDLPIAVDEIYRHWRNGCRVLAVVSAFEGVTDRLFKEATILFGAEPTA